MTTDKTTSTDRQLPDGSMPHFMLSFGKAEDGSYYAQIRMVGINTERMARCAADLLEKKFCGGELNAH